MQAQNPRPVVGGNPVIRKKRLATTEEAVQKLASLSGVPAERIEYMRHLSRTNGDQGPSKNYPDAKEAWDSYLLAGVIDALADQERRIRELEEK